MVKIKRLIDPYPGFSLMALAERASYELPDDKTKELSLPQTSFKV
jgi:hypothetical protein